MLLRRLVLENFRNIPSAALEFSGPRQFFAGANGQGKTNLIEAVGLLTALRSFRTPDSRLLIAHEHPEAAIACEVEHERLGSTRVIIKLRRESKELWWDETRVARLSDHLGRYPTVVFSSQDLQLVRGPPVGRRRWLDLALSAVEPAYFRALQTYSRALSGRNLLLKRGRTGGGAGSAGQLAAFERALAPAGAELVALRAAGLRDLAARLRESYARVAGSAEEATVEYASGLEGTSPEAFLALLETSRSRDLQAGATLSGPHRDDLRFAVRGVDAKDFASEGQQRSAVLALRLAQAAWFHERTGVRPVLLADDVLGELDPERRSRFWSAIDPGCQVIATGTTLPGPEQGPWQAFTVAGGAFSENHPSSAASQIIQP